jgi:hypothetical protein
MLRPYPFGRETGVATSFLRDAPVTLRTRSLLQPDILAVGSLGSPGTPPDRFCFLADFPPLHARPASSARGPRP